MSQWLISGVILWKPGQNPALNMHAHCLTVFSNNARLPSPDWKGALQNKNQLCSDVEFDQEPTGAPVYHIREKWIHKGVLSKKKKVEWILSNSIHLWSKKISLVKELISLEYRVKIHYSTSGSSSGSLDIHSKRSDHWCHYPGSETSENSLYFLKVCYARKGCQIKSLWIQRIYIVIRKSSKSRQWK